MPASSNSRSGSTEKGRDVKEYIDGVLHEYGAFIVIIVSVVFVKWLWSESKLNWQKWLRQVSVSILFGGLMGNYLAGIPEATMSEGLKGVILAFTVLQSDALFMGLMELGHRFRKDPTTLMADILDVWRGGGKK